MKNWRNHLEIQVLMDAELGKLYQIILMNYLNRCLKDHSKMMPLRGVWRGYQKWRQNGVKGKKRV